MPGFVQIMELKTSRIEEIEALVRDTYDELGSRLLASRSIQAADRDRVGHYFAIIEFDSYEVAMNNSNDPAVGEFAKRLGELLDEPPKFYNLDVLQTINR
ncbi:MAG: hypothetical protein ABSD85_05500 [Acidimicrobiales bacterium]